MVGKSDTNVRQIAHRAREHVHARRKRFQPEARTSQAVIGRFLLAAKTGDVQTLMDVMAPDVVQISDGGGQVTAARRPITGREPVARYITGLGQRRMSHMDARLAVYNALPAVLFSADGRLDSIRMFDIGDGLVHGLYAVRNPDKLRAADERRPLTR
ncbi:hypothetical protein AB0I53_08115 [Saccharopolyspora sp. NPDC050389]|uniref:hypothetical protein n=1 Tax=Saccharopolyspora sp. NPDC050389 TaxID=3155516 RepID=UPI0033EAAB45